MKKLFIVIPIVLMLSGCFGRARVIIVDADNAPVQIIQEGTIKVRAVDATTNDVEEVNKNVAGYYALSPQLYSKLVKVAAAGVKTEEKK